MAALTAVAAGASVIIASLTGNQEAIKKAKEKVEASKKNDANRTEAINKGEEQKKENMAVVSEVQKVEDVIKKGEEQIKTNEEIIKENEALLKG